MLAGQDYRARHRALRAAHRRAEQAGSTAVLGGEARRNVASAYCERQCWEAVLNVYPPYHGMPRPPRLATQ